MGNPIEPTIGRIVLVKLHGSTIIQPAIVHTVHSPDCVSVVVFGFEGAKPVGSISWSENHQSESNCWDWMPYQKSIAAEPQVKS